MKFTTIIITALSLVISVTTPVVAQQMPDKLRVCADPNNLPFSDKAQRGFENKIAKVLAEHLKLELEYTWFPQRMGFIRNTLKKWSDVDSRFTCDLVIGVPKGFDISDTTAPYYRSAYSIVFNKNAALKDIHSQEDFSNLPNAIKQKLRIAAFSPSPAVDWLQRYGLAQHTEFFRVMNGDPQDYPGKLIARVASGEFDMVLIWGPIGGYFTQQQPTNNLTILPLVSEDKIKFDFEISMGLRRREPGWKALIEQAITAKTSEIATILSQYSVPLLAMSPKVHAKDDD